MKRINNQISKIKHYFMEYQAFIVFSIILFGILSFVSSLPYINLYLTSDYIIAFMIIAFWIIILTLFYPSYKVSFVLAIIFCLFSYLLLLLGNYWLAEQTGNAIYILLITGSLQMMSSYLKKRENVVREIEDEPI